MWIMTPHGILMPAAIPTVVLQRFDEEWQTNPSAAPGIGTWNLQIRSRDRATLVKTRRTMIALGAQVSIIESTPQMDYEYRFYCDSRDFGEYMAVEINHINYEKFKPTTLRRGGGGEALHNLYNSIWGVVARFYDADILKTYAAPKSRKKGKKA